MWDELLHVIAERDAAIAEVELLKAERDAAFAQLGRLAKELYDWRVVYAVRCAFCHAPPGQPCRTRLYEEHAQHDNGEVHAEPHTARRMLGVSVQQQRLWR